MFLVLFKQKAPFLTFHFDSCVSSFFSLTLFHFKGVFFWGFLMFIRKSFAMIQLHDHKNEDLFGFKLEMFSLSFCLIGFFTPCSCLIAIHCLVSFLLFLILQTNALN